MALNEIYTITYPKIEDSYIPGSTRPPCKEEWRFRYGESQWGVKLVEKSGSFLMKETNMRPVLKEGMIGIYDYDEDVWKFYNLDRFAGFSIVKWHVDYKYRIERENEDGSLDIVFKPDERIVEPDTGKW